MQKRTREILALVLLGVFALIGVGAMGYYILVGHNWNVTASNIDDTIGQMDGYAVVLYEGTRPQGEADGELQVGSGVSAASSASGADLSSSDEDRVANIDAIAARYREKGAAVFVVDIGNLTRYSQPFIVGKRGKRLGLLGASRTSLRSAIRSDAFQLEKHGADYVIAITDDPALCNAAGDGLAGDISAIICDDPKGKAPNGEYRGGAYCVSAPEVGEVGALVISPSGVFSTKIADMVES